MRNKRNAAFLAGIGCEQGKANIPATDYAALLQPLGAIFAQQQAPTPPTDDSLGGLSEATAVCVDNAAAAVARMIMANPSAIPMSQVLPVLLAALPLKKDMAENEAVYTCLLGLTQMNHAAAPSHRGIDIPKGLCR